jgi:hypothetical protein
MFATCSFSANIPLLLRWIEARRRVEVTGVLAGNAELGGGAEGECGGDTGGGARRGQVGGAWRSLVCSPAARSSLATWISAATYRGPGEGDGGT